MLIVGAKGLAKEVLEIYTQRDALANLYFFDDISGDLPTKLYGKFPILRNTQLVRDLFKVDNRFIVAVGGPLIRVKLLKIFNGLGGELVSAISPNATIGTYGTTINSGSIIMAGSVITNDVTIGLSCLLNPNCTISHDTVIGNFVDISPGVQITGHCIIGDYCNLGTNATILPNITLKNNVTVGAGAVVTRNINEFQTVIGVPAKSIKQA